MSSHRRPPRRSTRRNLVLLLLIALVLGAGGWWGCAHTHGTVAALAPDDGVREPEAQRDARTVLLVGSDGRDGANAGYQGRPGEVTGKRADTIMLVHVPAGHDHAVAVSIPRDSWVTVPACGSAPEHHDQINATLATGGAQCLVRTVQHLTGLRITNYAELDFTGFKSVVDAVGGVPITLDAPVRDHMAGLDLPAGDSTLDGERALAFVRARYALGDGSDLGRLTRQHQFAAALADRVASRDVLLTPARLTSFGLALERAVTTDDGTSLTDLLVLVKHLHGKDSTHLRCLTAPIASPDFDPRTGALHGGARVLLDADAGRLLWDALIHDQVPS